MTARCPGHSRHWFSFRSRQVGGTGVRSPVCVRCGSPNPNELTSDEWIGLGELFPEKYGETADQVRESIREETP